jgi:hypothetical protein
VKSSDELELKEECTKEMTLNEREKRIEERENIEKSEVEGNNPTQFKII